ncbi:MAG: DUF4349 domain-containing protein [Solobacterium sp.]|nr:DUF4349 domain-containing protein [Solobacterium sp.]
MNKKWLIVLFVVFMLVGCGSSGGGSVTNDSSSYYDAKESVAESVSEEGIQSGYVAEVSEGEIDPTSTQEKLVYRGYLRIQTLTYKEAVEEIQRLIKEYKGLVEHQNEYNNNYGRWYEEDSEGQMSLEMTLRIPTEKFQEFINALDGAGKVISKETSIENITKKYNDNQTRITALEEQEKRLLEMLKEATTIEDMIAVEARLTEVQTDLNLLKSQRSSMDTDIAYSTIHLTLEEVKKYTHTNKSFFTRLQESFEDGWQGFVDFIEESIFFVARNLTLILILIVLFWLFHKKVKLPKLSMPKFFQKKNKVEDKENM